jgi:ABC-type bacteriocin/lantibiotic exporter with double-glycine peptidase domain
MVAFPLSAPPDRRQADGWSCGLITAQTCLDLLGRGELAGLSASPLDGTDPRAMECFFRRLGLPAQSGEMDWRDLAYHAARGRPVACLVQLDGCGHWVTAWRATSRRVSWQCPATGPRAATPAAFRRDWWDWDRHGVDYRCFGVAVGPDRKG